VSSAHRKGIFLLMLSVSLAAGIFFVYKATNGEKKTKTAENRILPLSVSLNSPQAIDTARNSWRVVPLKSVPFVARPTLARTISPIGTFRPARNFPAMRPVSTFKVQRMEVKK